MATNVTGRDQAVAEREEILSHGILFHNVVGFLRDAVETITARQGQEGGGRLRQGASGEYSGTSLFRRAIYSLSAVTCRQRGAAVGHDQSGIHAAVLSMHP